MSCNLEPAPRHKPGRGSQVRPAERREIQLLYLTSRQRSIKQLARDLGRTDEAVRNCLRGEDFNKLRDETFQEEAEHARNILRRNATRAADGWVDTFPVAIRRGDCRPMRALLESAGVLDNGKGSNIQVFVGVDVSEHLKSRPPGIDIDGEPKDDE